MTEYIKREDAVKALWKALYDYEDKTEKQFQESEDLELEDWYSHRIFVQRMSGEDLQAIINLPSVNVAERKKGKWEDNTKDGSWKCSECGFIFYSVGFYKIYNTKFRMRFCPNCGADMRHPDD